MVKIDPATELKDRRRSQLIDATLNVIARKGFASTTLADVAKEARVSYGVVSFYFKNKDALLLATLQQLADEYEAFWRAAAERAGNAPAAKLDAMIEVEFHPAISSRKKVSAWSAYWHESRSNAQYHKVCDGIEERYYDYTCALLRALIAEGGYRDLDAETIALGLNAMMDGLWLDLQVNPATFSREQAKRTCRTFMAALFPRDFDARARAVA